MKKCLQKYSDNKNLYPLHYNIFGEIFAILLYNIKGNQKGNIMCYARERANTKQPFWTVITFLTSVVY